MNEQNNNSAIDHEYIRIYNGAKHLDLIDTMPQVYDCLRLRRLAAAQGG